MDHTKKKALRQHDYVVLTPTTTKAAVTTISSLQRDGFRVFATGGDVAATEAWYPGIDGTNLHAFAGGFWNFRTPIEWPEDEAKYPMTFYAWYPAYPTGISDMSAVPYPLALRGRYTVNTVSAEQEDLVVGQSVAYEKPAGGNLFMTFDHALSKVDIGITPGKGAMPVVQAMGVAYVGGSRVFNFASGSWLPDQPDDHTALYPYYGTLDFMNGGAQSPVPLWSPGSGAGDDTTYYPFEPTGEGSMMLMPQTTKTWAPVAGSAPSSEAGLIYILYRMHNNQPAGYPHDEVGYASARSHPDYAGSGYEGPLFALTGFPISADATFTWEPGKGYRYNVGLGNIVGGLQACNGYLLSEYYYDNAGRQTSLRVRDGRRVGEKLNDGVIHVYVDISGWQDRPEVDM